MLIQSKEVLGFHIDFNLNQDNPNAIIFSLFLIVIVVFGFLTIFTFLGCCGSACQSNCMIGSFVIILFIFFGANVGGIVYMYFKYHDEVALASDELGNTIGKLKFSLIFSFYSISIFVDLDFDSRRFRFFGRYFADYRRFGSIFCRLPTISACFVDND